MQYPLFPPLWFKSQCYTVRECESDTLTRSVLYFLCRGVEVLCHCKKKKKRSRELHSRYCFLNSRNRRAFNLSPFFFLFFCYRSV